MIKLSGEFVRIDDFLLIPKYDINHCLINLVDLGESSTKLKIEGCTFYRPTRNYPIVAEITRIKPTFINRLKYVVTGNRSYLGDVIIIDEIGDKHGDN